MAVTIRLPSPGTADVQPTLSPLAELGAALHVLTSPEHHPLLGDWHDRVHATFSATLVEQFAALDFLWDGYRANFFLLDDGLPATRTMDVELDALGRLPVADFATEALQPLGTRPGERLAPGDRPGEGREQLLAHARARSAATEDTVAMLLTDPGRVLARLVDFLRRAGEAFFDAEWRGLAPSLRQSVEDARAVTSGRGPVTLLAGMSHGIHRLDDRTVVVDKAFTATIDLDTTTRLLVVPSLLCHPHVIVQANPVWPLSIQYPVHRRAPTQPLPPLEVTIARVEALADPSRRDLAALMANEARSTQELAGLTGLSAPTVSRHLKVLRDAGLAHTRQQGHFRLHRLDLDAVGDIGAALRASLLR